MAGSMTDETLQRWLAWFIYRAVWRNSDEYDRLAIALQRYACGDAISSDYRAIRGIDSAI